MSARKQPAWTPEWFSPEGAAHYSGTGTDYIRRRIKDGSLPARVRGENREYFTIARADLDEFMRRFPLYVERVA